MPWLLSLIGLLGIGSATTAAAIFFPGFGLALAAFGKAALSWLSKRSLAEIAAIALILALAIDHLALLEAHRENGKLATQLASAVKAKNDASNALAQTVANYRAAAVQAEAADKANVQRVQTEQAKINQETSSDYQARINSAHADVQRLRDELAAKAAPGGSAAAPVPVVPTPTCGADAPTLDPVTRAFDCAIQLDSLIDWAKKQAGVDVSGK